MSMVSVEKSTVNLLLFLNNISNCFKKLSFSLVLSKWTKMYLGEIFFYLTYLAAFGFCDLMSFIIFWKYCGYLFFQYWFSTGWTSLSFWDSNCKYTWISHCSLYFSYSFIFFPLRVSFRPFQSVCLDYIYNSIFSRPLHLLDPANDFLIYYTIYL